MARSQQAVNSFSAGVWSPRLTLRADRNPYTSTDKYAEALQECKNFYVSPQGGITYREGFKNIAPTGVANEPSRLFNHRGGGSTSDMLVEISSDLKVRFYVDAVKRSEEPDHFYDQQDLAGIRFTNRLTTGIVTHPTKPPYYIKQALDGTITGNEMPFLQIPQMYYFDSKSPTRQTNVNEAIYTLTFDGLFSGDKYHIIYGDVTSDVFAPGNDPELLIPHLPLEYISGNDPRNQQAIKGALLNNALLNGAEQTVVVTGTDPTYTITMTSSSSVNKNIGLEMVGRLAGDSGGADKSITIAKTGDVNGGREPAWSYPHVVLHNGNYYRVDVPHVAEADTEPGVGVDWQDYWTDLGTTKPDWFDWQHPTAQAWGTLQVYAPWDRGFPAVAVFREQRLLFMSAKDATTGVWGSRIADFEDFVLGAQDDDPFYFDIDTSDSPEIKWAQSQRNLIIGTSSGDYAISSEVTLTPSDIKAEKQNNARSHESDAVVVNTDIFYIEKGKEKIRSTGYVRDLQSQSSIDISVAAENLMRPRGKRIELMQTPEVVMFTLREDGSLTCISYVPEQDVGAWYEFVSQGHIEDIAVLYSNRLVDPLDPFGPKIAEDELWAVITYDGGLSHYIERMPYPNRDLTARLIEDKEDTGGATLIDQGIVCLDGWVIGQINAGDNNIIQGLDQFNGHTVAVLVDDAWAGEYEVVNGTIILDAPEIEENWVGATAIGFIYNGQVKTYEVNKGNQRGEAFGTMRRWNKLYVRLLDSALPVVNGTLPPDRTPETLMDIPEIIRQGLQDVIIRGAGWGDGSVTILQDRPYPTHVLGMFGEFNSNNA